MFFLFAGKILVVGRPNTTQAQIAVAVPRCTVQQPVPTPQVAAVEPVTTCTPQVQMSIPIHMVPLHPYAFIPTSYRLQYVVGMIFTHIYLMRIHVFHVAHAHMTVNWMNLVSSAM